MNPTKRPPSEKQPKKAAILTCEVGSSSQLSTELQSADYVQNKELITVKTAEEALFMPSAKQAQVKVRFWKLLKEKKLTREDLDDIPKLAYILKNVKLKEWFENPAFVSWFTQESDIKDRIESLVELALARATSILTNPESRESDQIALIKLLLSHDKRFPEQTTKKLVEVKASGGPAHLSDEQIEGLSDEQLKALLGVANVEVGKECLR